MLDTLRMLRELEAVMDPTAAQKIVELVARVYEDLRDQPSRADFDELKGIVQQLAEAQKRTEARVEELAEAQKRTEARVEELAEAQKRTEERVDTLALRMEELAEAQKRTEARVEELTEVVQGLAIDQKETRQLLGNLTHTIGYTLEDRAYRSLPALLERDYGIRLVNGLVRRYVTDNRGNKVEINVFGRGTRNGDEVTIIGESKSQLSQNDIDRFLSRRVARLRDQFPNIFPLFITYMVSDEEVEEYARDQGIALYYSYQFDI